ncbi:piggyBac transposable element-derived protein 4-like [Macrobrachium nipponense]|uniref:piggyBac transposable element-derived protein 4-like n=1 Tax=Macrobrachium nipponense TaxID=159736 RepID=UPI0030C7F246
MSVIGIPRIRMYWERYTRIDLICRNMTRDRYFKIRSNLKVVDDNMITVASRKCDRLWKIRPILDSVRSRCLELPRPGKVSVDESMIPFRGKCSLRQHVPGKPNPDGLKCFVLASPNGTVLDFEIFTGKEPLTEIVREHGVLPDRNVGIGEAAVLRFVRSVDPGTIMYFDRYFTSPALLLELIKHNLLWYRYYKKNMLPKGAKLKSEKEMAKLGRGATYNQVRSDGAYAITQWHDKKVVLMASTIHSTEPQDECKRWSKKENKHIKVNRPAAVREYNVAMGGVDVHDQILSYYRSSSKTNKWTVRCILHFLDVATSNAWMEYKVSCGELKKYLDFKMSLAIQLIDGALWSNAGQQQGPSDNHDEEDEPNCSAEMPVEKRQRSQPLPSKDFRTNEAKHMPLALPPNSEFKRCRNPGCMEKCRIMCSSCEVFLCLTSGRNCFIAFHSP